MTPLTLTTTSTATTRTTIATGSPTQVSRRRRRRCCTCSAASRARADLLGSAACGDLRDGEGTHTFCPSTRTASGRDGELLRHALTH